MKGKIAFVTGGSSGIGQTVCVELAKKGVHVAFSDLNEEGAKETLKLLKIKSKFIQGDVSKEEDVKRMINEVVKEYGRLDLAFNNAGIASLPMKLHEVDELTFNKIMAVNVKGVFLCMKYEIEQMLKQGGTGYSIVNTSSISGLVAYRLGAIYGASKHAVVGLTKSAAIEYARSGIRINAICPAFTNTPMVGDAGGSGLNLEKRIPLNRLGTTNDVASIVLFLFSQEADFFTALAIPVCGGLSAL